MKVIFGLITAVVLLLSLLGVSLMGADKGRAKKGKWRIPEKSLLLVALLGGSPGILLGMKCFRHKTRRWYFRYGVPAILLLQAVLLAALVDWSAILR